MTIDLASFRMEYEAERDWIASVLSRNHKPPEMRSDLHESYLLGYRTGLRKSMQFDPCADVSAIVELEWEFEAAWNLGYREACFVGQFMRETIVRKVAERRGVHDAL